MIIRASSVFRFRAENVRDSGVALGKSTLDFRVNELGERDVVVGPGDDCRGARCIVAAFGNTGV